MNNLQQDTNTLRIVQLYDYNYYRYCKNQLESECHRFWMTKDEIDEMEKHCAEYEAEHVIADMERLLIEYEIEIENMKVDFDDDDSDDDSDEDKFRVY